MTSNKRDRDRLKRRVVVNAPNVDLELLYKSIRSVYIQEYRRFVIKKQGKDPVSYGSRPIPSFDGGRHPNNGRMYKPVWPKIALFAYKNNIHPYDLVRAVFANAEDLPPLPSFFLSQIALENARRFKKQAYPIFEMEVKAAIRKIKVSAATLMRRYAAANFPIEEERALLKAMTEDNMNPLACVMVAVEMQQPSLASFFYDAAANIYAGYAEEIDKTFGALIPKDLKEYAQNTFLTNLNCSHSGGSYNELH